ncbi:sushi, von Willebrand factor type A, EGF and pentraxin domain-containing protein 1 isoform X1 [Tachysurus ichikawai]
MAKKDIDVVTIHGNGGVLFHKPKQKVDRTMYLQNKHFHFDYTFNEDASNDLVYRWSPSFSSNSCFPVIFEKPLPILHGNIKGDNYNYGDMIVYTCVPGFELQGHGVQICQGDRTWSGSQPECVVTSCGPPPIVENAADGTWSSPAPTCEASKGCEKPGGFINWKVLEQSLVSWKALRFFCNKGYALQGESLVACMGNGSWSSPFPICTRKATNHNYSTAYITSPLNRIHLQRTTK